MSQQGLRRRVQELASNLVTDSKASFFYRPIQQDASDLRALLAAHKQAKRELAVCKKALREIRLHPWKVCGELDGIEKKGVKL